MWRAVSSAYTFVRVCRFYLLSILLAMGDTLALLSILIASRVPGRRRSGWMSRVQEQRDGRNVIILLDFEQGISNDLTSNAGMYPNHTLYVRNERKLCI